MFIRPKRHIAKAITWRIVGTIDTIILSWVISGNPFTGVKIGFAEVVTKLLFYYLHERIWLKVHWAESRKRHLAKTVSWRIWGTLDTMTLAWIISGNPLTGVKIGFAEVVTKMLLYYLHERVWHKSSFGVIDAGDPEFHKPTLRYNPPESDHSGSEN